MLRSKFEKYLSLLGFRNSISVNLWRVMYCVSQNDQLLLNTETVDDSCVYSGGLLYEVNHRTTKVLARGVFLLSQSI